MKLCYPTVDHLAEHAFELAESFGQLRAQDPCAIRAERCRTCGTPRTLRYVRTTKAGEIILGEFCSGPCRKPWIHGLWESIEVRRRQHAKRVSNDREVRQFGIDIPPRRDAAESAIAAQIDEFRVLRRVVFPPARSWDNERWDFALQCWRLFLHAKLGSYRRVAAYGAISADERIDWWTEDIVQRWLERARGVVARRASERRYPVKVLSGAP